MKGLANLIRGIIWLCWDRDLVVNRRLMWWSFWFINIVYEIHLTIARFGIAYLDIIPRIGRQSMSIMTFVPIQWFFSAFTTNTMPHSCLFTWAYPCCRSLNTSKLMVCQSPSSPSWLMTRCRVDALAQEKLRLDCGALNRGTTETEGGATRNNGWTAHTHHTQNSQLIRIKETRQIYIWLRLQPASWWATTRYHPHAHIDAHT